MLGCAFLEADRRIVATGGQHVEYGHFFRAWRWRLMPAIAAAAACVVSAAWQAAAEQTASVYGAIAVPTEDSSPRTQPLAEYPEGNLVKGGELDNVPLAPLESRIPAMSCWLWPHVFRHADPDDPARHIGRGCPLVGTSWLNRPFHAGWQCGALLGDSLIDGHVGQQDGLFGAYQLGWDFDHYWGTEARFGFAFLDVVDGQVPPRDRTSRDHYWDVHLVHYPWGDARWRPFLSVGVGVASFSFEDDRRQPINDAVLAFPFGCGVKYLLKPWVAVRLAAVDNLALGAYNLSTMHNVSLTAGVEVRCGGPRTSYYPYDPGMHLW